MGCVEISFLSMWDSELLLSSDYFMNYILFYKLTWWIGFNLMSSNMFFLLFFYRRSPEVYWQFLTRRSKNEQEVRKSRIPYPSKFTNQFPELIMTSSTRYSLKFKTYKWAVSPNPLFPRLKAQRGYQFMEAEASAGQNKAETLFEKWKEYYNVYWLKKMFCNVPSVISESVHLPASVNATPLCFAVITGLLSGIPWCVQKNLRPFCKDVELKEEEILAVVPVFQYSMTLLRLTIYILAFLWCKQ